MFTPVDVDGTLAGPALDELEDVARAAQESGASLIYSGGIGSVNNSGSLATLTINAASDRSFSGTIGGNLNLAKSGVGAQTLRGDSPLLSPVDTPRPSWHGPCEVAT